MIIMKRKQEKERGRTERARYTERETKRNSEWERKNEKKKQEQSDE